MGRREALFILTLGPLPPEVGTAVMLRNGVAGGTLILTSRHSGLHPAPATYRLTDGWVSAGKGILAFLAPVLSNRIYVTK